MSSTKGTATPRRKRVAGPKNHNVYVRADGTYEVGYRDSTGKQRWRVPGYSSTFPNITMARKARDTVIGKMAGGERVVPNPKLTFNAAADLWWEARVMKLRPATQSAYAADLKHLRPVFGRRLLSEIESSHIATFITKQSKTQKGWTVKGQLTVLSAVFKYASRHQGHTGVNPVSLLDKTERPSNDDAAPKRILTTDELRRLLASVDNAHRLIFELTAETGCRLGEVLGLTWECIDFDGESVHFREQLDRHTKKLSPLKTKRSRRWVEVTPALIHKLRAHKLATASSGDQDLVFTTRTGSAHDHRNIGGRVLARAVAEAELQAVERDGVVVLPAPTMHDLRHSHASALIAQGWDIEEVSSRLGHADTAITQRTYVHEFDRARRSADRRERLTKIYDRPDTAGSRPARAI